MKKAILTIILTLMAASGLWSQTPGEIVKRCIDAMGGEETIKKSLDFKAEGDMKMTYGMMEFSGKIEAVMKNRKSWNKIKVTFQGTEIVAFMAFDGESGWMERMGTVADQPALNFESDLDHTPLLLLEKDAVFTAAMETEIEGKKVIGIDVDFKGKKTTFFIDREDHTILEIVYEDLYYGDNQVKKMMEKRIRYTDYKEFDGVFFHAGTVIYQEGKKFMEMHFDKIVFNPIVSPDIFKRPDQELDLRYIEEIIH